MTRLLLISGLLMCASIAEAQVSVEATPGTPREFAIATFDPENAVAPVSIVEGPGWKIGEGTVLHPVVGMETGFISNVFYTSANAQPSGVLRLLAQIGTASLNQARLDPNAPLADNDIDNVDTDAANGVINKGSFSYTANARLAYDQMLSGDQVVRDTGGLGIGVLLRGMVNPMGTVSFGSDESFTRLIRAANFETNVNANRDINDLRLQLLYHPYGRTLSGYLYYQNLVDIFESQGQLYPDRMTNKIGVHPMWRWLPQTTIYGDISGALVGGVGSSIASMRKSSSEVLTFKAGIATLLTLNTTLTVQGGYTNGSYDMGPSFSAPTIDALAAYRYSPFGRIGASYSLIYTDSVNANFYRDHVIRAYVQQVIDPVVFVVQPEVHFREYNGITIPGAPIVRDDDIFAVIAGAHYTFRNWIAATLDYRFSTVQTDFRYMDTTGGLVDPSFVRHELLLGIRVAM